ncbi:MAG: hypothetical protein KF761_12615 [Salinibacterium sp.]|nr:hypothetical protein [Salinibacterium sp.]
MFPKEGIVRFEYDGQEICQVAFGPGDLQIGATNDVRIMLENHAELTLNGKRFEFVVGEWRGVPEVLVGLLGQGLRSLQIDGAVLTVELSDGHLVATDSGLEPWTLNLPGSPSFIVGRGGDEPMIWD